MFALDMPKNLLENALRISTQCVLYQDIVNVAPRKTSESLDHSEQNL